MRKRIRERLDRIETRNVAVLCLFLVSLILTFTRYEISVRRLISAVCGAGRSIAYWFVFVCEDIFTALTGDVPEIRVTVTDMPSVDIAGVLPFSADRLFYKIENFGFTFFSAENFGAYNVRLLKLVYDITMYSSLLLPLAVMLFLLGKYLMTLENSRKLGSRTVFLRTFDICASRIKPPAAALVSFFKYFYERRAWFYLMVAIWAVNLNAATICAELLSFYYYFLSSFDLLSIFTQLYKLGVDAVIMFFGAPLVFWIIVSYLTFDYLRKRKGYDALEHNEAKNCGFAKQLNICSLVVGPMGVGKTSFVTDLVLSFVNIFKKASYDILYRRDMLFPHFPWEVFERDIRDMISSHVIYNLPCVDLYVDTLESAYERTPSPAVLYNYDYDTYGIEKNVGHKTVTLFDALRTYGKAYFVYLNENPSQSNYPIRFDGKFKKSRFFPRWRGDFFRTRPDERESRYSHILDQDLFRLGKPVDPENELAGTFSFGIYSVMEFGKSQKNQVEAQDIDKSAEESNQKNDLYDYALKVARHANVMVDNEVFFRFLADDQRPQSIPQKLRDCFSVVTIGEKSELKLAMPCFAAEEWIYKHVYEPFKNFYYSYRENRGDRTLTFTLMKLFVSLMSNYYRRIYNIFGYYELDVAVEAGTAYGDGSPMDKIPTVHKYYLSVKKVYGDRYSTDALSEFFTKKQLECPFGINDYETYGGLRMTNDEMQKQHERYIMELMQVMIGEKEPVNKRRKKERISCDWDIV
ncbi:MAG: hypothetical protein IJ038_05145 [Clostridia bacterium]|nr:hypothetical protein [Clostridia bacterium]